MSIIYSEIRGKNVFHEFCFYQVLTKMSTADRYVNLMFKPRPLTVVAPSSTSYLGKQRALYCFKANFTAAERKKPF